MERCFIITPIGKKTDNIRRHIDGIIEAVIRPVIEKDYEVVVSHKMNDIGSINKQIIKEIYNDKLVIANLTTINPNVMYELAFRHSIGKPVIIIAEEGTVLPFDISIERTIFYKNDAQGTIELQDTLKDFISSIDFSKPTSPIYDVLGELKKETDLLYNLKSENNKDESNSLSYILNRLDSIESAINTSIIRDKPNSPKLREREFHIEILCKSIPKTPNKKIIYLLQKSILAKTDIFLLNNISIDRESNIIIIDGFFMDKKASENMEKIINMIDEALMELGFEIY